MIKNPSVRMLTQASVIAAMYAVLTLSFFSASYGQVQIRVSEALTVLPYFTPAAIPGLFAGCLIANALGPNGLIDVVAGSLATLLAAIVSRHMPGKWLVPLPPVVINGIVIGVMLHYVAGLPVVETMLSVAAGQAVSCCLLGYPLLLILEKHRERLFKK